MPNFEKNLEQEVEQDLALQCQCGEVKGRVLNATPDLGTRLVCYCQDCRDFARQLPETDIMDEFGGTELIHYPPSSVTLDSGLEHVACLRLTKRGSHRWYAKCCNTPIGYTVRPWVPFIGIIHNFIADKPDAESKTGPLLGAVNLERAECKIPKEVEERSNTGAVMLRVFKKLIGWLFTGKGKPSPVYLKNGKPIVEPRVVEKVAK